MSGSVVGPGSPTFASAPPRGCNAPLRIYSDRAYLPGGSRPLPLLRPFWNCDDEEDGPLNVGRFAEYYRSAHQHFRLTSIEEADAVVYPAEWVTGEPNPLALKLAELARRHGKPVLIMCISDADEPIEVPGTIVFRTSLRASRRLPNEFAMPCWSVDFRVTYGQAKPNILPKPARPTVGYVGYVDYLAGRTGLHTLVRALRCRSSHPGASLRGRAVRSLLRSPRVDARIVVRGGGLTGLATYEQRLEYANNMLDNAYALACRGRGNYSYRLYEAMSCGRIPVFVDSDCVLPYDHYVDWREFMVWVPARGAHRVADRVADMHESLSDDQFLGMQTRSRAVYDSWVSPRGFYANLWRCLG